MSDSPWPVSGINDAMRGWTRAMSGWIRKSRIYGWTTIVHWEPGRRLPSIWPFKAPADIPLVIVAAEPTEDESLVIPETLWEFLLDKGGVLIWVRDGWNPRWMVVMPHDHVALRMSPLKRVVAAIPARYFQVLQCQK